MDSKLRIGIFDSGVGGITVLKEALRQMPHEHYLYYADTLHVPYGVKPKELVRGYIFDAAAFIAKQKIKLLIIACNTATSIAVKELRSLYKFPIIGMEPAVKPAVEINGNKEKRVLVVATPLALQEEKFQRLIARVDQQRKVDFLPLPSLVEFAEKLEFRSEIVVPYLKKVLSPFDLNNYSTLVLGCTHFPFFKSSFKEILPADTFIIDGNEGTIRHAKNILMQHNLLADEDNGKNPSSGNNIDFYSSGQPAGDLELNRYLTLLKKA